MVDARSLLQQAVDHHNAGRLAMAEAGYRDALGRDPDNVDGLYLLGVVLAATNRPEEAVGPMRRAAALAPQSVPIRKALGGVLRRLDCAEEAEQTFGSILADAPNDLEAAFFLGVVQRRLGRHQDALNTFQRAAVLHPQVPELHVNVGAELVEMNRLAEAEAHFRRALEVRPDFIEGLVGLAALLMRLRRSPEALDLFRGRASLLGQHPEGLANLAVVVADTGDHPRAIMLCRRAIALRPDHAAAYLNLAASQVALGDLSAGEADYRRALSCNPQDDGALVSLANTLHIQGRVGEAVRAGEAALRINPGNARAHNAIGNSLLAMGRLEEAAGFLADGIKLDPNCVEAINNLGAVRRNQGRIPEAVAAFRDAVRIDPANVQVHSNLLLTLCYDETVDDGALYQAHLDWARVHEAPILASPSLRRPPPIDRRRVRVGYVSPDLRDHAAAYFLEPLLANHDRSRFELFAYAEVKRPDAATERLKGYFDHWRSSVGVSDQALAELIRRDGIDILVDLAGHTANNRLLAFARRPAPIQVTWLGYATTTGMASMDYFLLDRWVVPEEFDQDRYYTEKIWRLPRVHRPFTPSPLAPDVGPLPCLRKGRVTFGSLNAYVKIGPGVVRLWSQVLKAVPSSELHLVADADPDAVRARFLACGIEGSRIRVTPKQPLRRFLELFNDIDVALDPFPHSGGTTTFHSLWMGVPVLSLNGERFSHRGTAGICGPLGLPELIPLTGDAYVRTAQALASDTDRLAGLRARLRGTLAASPFLDHAGLAQDIEDAYNSMLKVADAGGSFTR